MHIKQYTGLVLHICCSVAQSCLTLCDPMDCTMPGLLVLHYLPEFAQSHVHWFSDAIQPFYSLSPSSPALSLSHIRLFSMSWLFALRGQSIGISASTSVLPMNIQGWFPLGLTGLISFLTKRLSRVFSSATIQKHQFFGTQLPLSISYIHTWLLKNQSFDYMDLCQQSDLYFLMCHLGLS